MNRTSTALPSASYQANVRKVTLLALLVLLAAVCYMVVAVNFGSQHLMLYSMKIRTPKLVVMLITAFAIGGLLSTLVADFENINSEIIVFALVLLAGLIFVLRRDLALLDVLTLGKHQAINLGVDYDRSIRRLLLGVTLCIAVATAMVGPISFLGLIIANIARQLFKTYRHTYLILGSALVGMVVLVAGQLVVERVYHYAVPVSVFITVGGGIYFLYLLLSNRRV